MATCDPPSNATADLREAWSLNVIAWDPKGNQSIHANGDLSHQDVKPSNIMTFADAQSRRPRRASDGSDGSLHTADAFGQGDPTYPPPELLYRRQPRTIDRLGLRHVPRRLMIVFLATGSGLTPRSSRSSTDLPLAWLAELLPERVALLPGCLRSGLCSGSKTVARNRSATICSC